MEARITAVEDSQDGLRSLHAWLIGEEELRGRVLPSTLGSGTDVLVVDLAPGGAMTVLACVVIAWMRYRVHDVVYEITRPDGSSVQVAAKLVRDLDTTGVRELVGELSRRADDAR